MRLLLAVIVLLSGCASPVVTERETVRPLPLRHHRIALEELRRT
jgi:uncharacterized protein YceK